LGTVLGDADEWLCGTRDGNAALTTDAAGIVRVRVPRCNVVLPGAESRWRCRSFNAATVGPPGLDARVVVVYQKRGGVGCVDTAVGGPGVALPISDEFMFEDTATHKGVHAWHREGGGLWLVLLSNAWMGGLEWWVFTLENGAKLEYHWHLAAELPTTPLGRTARVVVAVRCMGDTGTAWIVVRGDGRVFDRLQMFERHVHTDDGEDNGDDDTAYVTLLDLLAGEALQPWERLQGPRGWRACSVTAVAPSGRPVVEFV